MAKRTQTTAYLHWARAEDDVIISGTTVQAGKLVRMRADWQPSPSYMGPEVFFLHQQRSRLFRVFRSSPPAPAGFEADFDGPPTTHSRDAWQAGASSVTNQARWIFKDSHQNSSGVLMVSNVAFYTSTPHFEAATRVGGAIPGAVGAANLTARAGNAKTIFHIGATADPVLRVSIMVPWGVGEANLRDHVEGLRAEAQSQTRNPRSSSGRGRDIISYMQREPGPWVPAFRER